ncbi:MAG: hypothetical protein Q9160_007424 [Pyrenula sp. 1 TL-2023]
MTGGADGAVLVRYSHRLPQAELPDESVGITTSTIPFKNIFQGYRDTLDLHKSSMLKNYTWLSNSCFIATGDRGQVWRGALAPADDFTCNERSEEPEETEHVEWQTVSIPNELGSNSIAASSERQGIALISDESGRLWLVTRDMHSLQHLTLLKRKAASIFVIHVGSALMSLIEQPGQIIYALLTYLGSDMADLICVYRSIGRADFEYRHIADMQLPPTFTVTSCLFCPQSSVLILGSRAGAVAVYENILDNDNTCLQHSLCKRHIHGEDAVTYLTSLPSASNPDTYFLSCGRDGHYAAHVVPHKPTQIQLNTVHRSTLPFGPNIEGAYFSQPSQDLILYGFRSKDFVVWNESAQMQVLSVECGGVHRSWAFRGNGDGQGGNLIWNRASSFHLFSQARLIHRHLQKGGHGREIKAIVYSSSGFETPLLVTGAEDTAIRFFTLIHEVGGKPKLHCVRTFKKHTTGIQDLQWSPCGQLLFSSAGCEELFVWRVSNIPGFGVGAICEAALPKETPVSDLRITSFDIRILDAEENGASQYLVAAAYSNSTLKLFRYNGSDATFELEAYGLYKTNCLTQISFLPENHDQSSHCLLSASTDGSIALWSHATPKLEPDPQTSGVEVSELQCITSHTVHQSSIKALQIVPLSATHLLVITGGDDNTLALTILGPAESPMHKLSPKPSSSSPFQLSTLLIPRAHTATITALAVSPSPLPSNPPTSNSSIHSSLSPPSQSPASFRLFSTGTDQRIKSWRIFINVPLLQTLEDEARWMEAVQVIKGESFWTSVADVGGMCTLDGDSNDSEIEREGSNGKETATATRLAIAGVGMEVLDVDVDIALA